MREVKLGASGLVALVDDEDFDLVNEYKWYLKKPNRPHYTFYTYRRWGVYGDWVGRRYKSQRMHNLIMQELWIDHIDGDGLNNQKSNLRKCTNSENLANVRNTIGSSSRYKGVYLRKDTQKWDAHICKDRKKYALGSYTLEVEAALAYDRAAQELFGEFARLNFPLEETGK